MLKHRIMWQLKDELTESEKEHVKKDIKKSFEELDGKIPGLISIRVIEELLPSSNMDLLLACEMEDEEALKVYKDHPLHIACRDTKVKPNVKSRVCVDFIV